MQPPDLSKLIEGDQLEWDVAFDWLWDSARKMALLTGMNRCCADDAEDVASDAISVLLRRLKEGNVKTSEELKALLLRIVHDKAIDHCRELFTQKRGGGKTTRLEDLPESMRSMLLATGDSPLEKLEKSEFVELARKAGKKLKDKEWLVLEDFFLNELSYKEISKKHGIPVKSLGVYIKRSIDKLRRLLKKYM